MKSFGDIEFLGPLQIKCSVCILRSVWLLPLHFHICYLHEGSHSQRFSHSRSDSFIISYSNLFAIFRTSYLNYFANQLFTGLDYLLPDCSCHGHDTMRFIKLEFLWLSPYLWCIYNSWNVILTTILFSHLAFWAWIINYIHTLLGPV